MTYYIYNINWESPLQALFAYRQQKAKIQIEIVWKKRNPPNYAVIRAKSFK